MWEKGSTSETNNVGTVEVLEKEKDMIIKDVTGKEISVGDTVAYCVVGYSNLQVGLVTKITPKGMRVDGMVQRNGSQVCKVNG